MLPASLETSLPLRCPASLHSLEKKAEERRQAEEAKLKLERENPKEWVAQELERRHAANVAALETLKAKAKWEKDASARREQA